MQTATALVRLHEHQDRILAHIGQGGGVAIHDPAAARDGLAQGRWTLIRMLREYQIFKHHEIFDPAIASGGPRCAAAARRLKANCIQVGEQFRNYATRWSARDIVADWAEYLPAMRAMSDVIRDHIAIERREIATLLADTEDTRRPAAA